MDASKPKTLIDTSMRGVEICECPENFSGTSCEVIRSHCLHYLCIWFIYLSDQIVLLNENERMKIDARNIKIGKYVQCRW